MKIIQLHSLFVLILRPILTFYLYFPDNLVVKFNGLCLAANSLGAPIHHVLRIPFVVPRGK